jgi:hypothetical protein
MLPESSDLAEFIPTIDIAAIAVLFFIKSLRLFFI